MNNDRTVLVCVTAQLSSEKLVRVGKALAEKSKADLEVVSVLPIADGKNEIDCQALENIYSTAKSQGGEMAVYFSDEPTLTAAAHIAKRKPLTVVTGFPGADSKGFIAVIHMLFPELPVTMVDKDGRIYNMLPKEAMPLPAVTLSGEG